MTITLERTSVAPMWTGIQSAPMELVIAAPPSRPANETSSAVESPRAGEATHNEPTVQQKLCSALVMAGYANREIDAAIDREFSDTLEDGLD